ncbi:flavodoxin-dependent (E)-4-hydroxy-3-methylbut-2-enyl-diphosphate synthase [Candidatus Micrarchaeota archaeon]|nr:flavodoxin-dependent (E)-4-hydroxy-3-methylbut-2-enyl-diphosphate synthase [Candidatus Micrarchaeota archaeon]
MKRKSIEVKVGKIIIGGNNPIVIQSMTNTPTENVNATVQQIKELADAGSELVRFTVKDDAGAKAVPEIKKKLIDEGYEVPLIGDFHYNGHILLTKFPKCAEALDKFRINPGNVGFGSNKDDNFEAMVKVAVDNDIPVRIGVNWGSLDQSVLAKLMDENAKNNFVKSNTDILIESLVVSAVESTKKANELGLGNEKIVISAKSSRVPDMIKAYELLAERCDNALHLGVTEAGQGLKGAVHTAVGLSVLLHKGIGDTIRCSLTPTPGASRTEEVKIAKQVLQSLKLRHFMPEITSCPGCGRTTSTVFQEIALHVQKFLEEKSPEWKKKGFKGFEKMEVAVMGCIVNGPGESKNANIGLSLPGAGENPNAVVFADGKQIKTLKGNAKELTKEFTKLIEEYVESHYSN